MTKTTRIATTLALTLLTLVSASAVEASNPYIDIPEMQRLSHEAATLWWQSLTPRQKQLERAISYQVEAHRQRTGQLYIPATQENFQALMRTIGAGRGDASFVWERLNFYAQLGQTLGGVDRFIENAQRNPQWYLPPHMRQ